MANGPHHHVYNSHHWRKLRLQVLDRDCWTCRLCGRALYGKRNGKRGNAAVDHIKPLSKGGAPYDPGNLRAVCGSCNSVLSNQKVPRVVVRQYPPRAVW